MEHSTRNNSIAETILNEVLSEIELLQDTNDDVEVNLNENCDQMPKHSIQKEKSMLKFTCGECSFKTHEKDIMNSHVKSKHSGPEKDQSILQEYNCI